MEENFPAVRFDDRFVYSVSGRAYPRQRARNVAHHAERRFPFVKAVNAKGHRYYYFVKVRGSSGVRLPHPDTVGFDHAYLAALAEMENEAPPRWRQPQKCHVYFIQAGEGGPIKIGIARNVSNRLAELQTAHHTKLELIATRDGGLVVERDYHRRFAEHRLHGEWFSPHPEILAEIARLPNPHQATKSLSETTGGSR